MLSGNLENILWLIAPGVIPGGTSGDILGEIYRGILKEFMDQEKSEVIFGGNYGKNP